MKNLELDIDFSDLTSLINLMNNSEKYPTILMGQNEEGENVWISINKNNITLQTFQNNDWMRTNIYYRDGTVEELYDK